MGTFVTMFVWRMPMLFPHTNGFWKIPNFNLNELSPERKKIAMDRVSSSYRNEKKRMLTLIWSSSKHVMRRLCWILYYRPFFWICIIHGDLHNTNFGPAAILNEAPHPPTRPSQHASTPNQIKISKKPFLVLLFSRTNRHACLSSLIKRAMGILYFHFRK